ncbi:hypothetical protein AOA61_05260 [Pseudomonas sp. 2995-1]|nr:hypothetical protein AOA61_05260 [Pseudomonas sp. 2995-1]
MSYKVFLSEVIMITVGGKRVIGTSSIMVPNGEKAIVVYEFDDTDKVTCSFSFAESSEEGEDKGAQVSFRGKDDCSEFVFINFNSAPGHSTGKPIVFGTSDLDEDISLMATVYKYKRSHRIDFQIMVGNVDE